VSKDRAQHDQFFKFVFSKAEIARLFLSLYLPPKICKHLDFSSIVLLKDSFVDDDMKQYFSDLIYQIEMKGTHKSLYVCILLEHKSEVDDFVALQLLCYMAAIWRDSYKKGEKLMGIFPLVFYHGEAAWHVPTNFQALLDVPKEMKDYMPEFRYHLCSISEMEDEDIKGDAVLKSALYSLKYVPRKGIKENLERIFNNVFDIEDPEKLEMMAKAMISYLSRARERLTIKDIETVTKDVKEQRGEAMKDLYDMIVEQGERKGKREGLLEGLKIAIDMKFGEPGLSLMSELQKVNNIKVLESVWNTLKAAQSPEELRKIYKPSLQKEPA
jgi:predicted transposase/invertase (TIGR01784 family)